MDGDLGGALALAAALVSLVALVVCGALRRHPRLLSHAFGLRGAPATSRIIVRTPLLWMARPPAVSPPAPPSSIGGGL